MAITIMSISAVVVIDRKGNKEIFAPDSFAQMHPKLTPHIFVCPDEQFYSEDFEAYAEKRLTEFYKEEGSNEG